MTVLSVGPQETLVGAGQSHRQGGHLWSSGAENELPEFAPPGWQAGPRLGGPWVLSGSTLSCSRALVHLWTQSHSLLLGCCSPGLGDHSSSQPSGSLAPVHKALGGEGRKGMRVSQAQGILLGGGRSEGVLEAPFPTGSHGGLCLVVREQETPHPGETPPHTWRGPSHHFPCRGVHPG